MFVYADNAATTAVSKKVVDAMFHILQKCMEIHLAYIQLVRRLRKF